MKFFTREWYQAMQPVLDGEDKEWNDEQEELTERAGDQYARHWREIQHKIPTSAWLLDFLSFHDSYIVNAEELDQDSIRLTVNATDNPWGPNGWFHLLFSGVVECQGLTDAIGDSIVYEEIDVHDVAGFEYRALLENSELRIACNEFDLFVIDPIPEKPSHQGHKRKR